MHEAEDKPILFGPRSGKHLRRTYPELDDEPAFKGLNNEDMYFAWLMGIPGSPIDEDWETMVRLKAAVKLAYPRNEVKKQKHSHYTTIPEEIKQAIKRFESYVPEARLKAKLMQQRMMVNYEIIVNQDVSSMDSDEKQKYTSTTVKINEALPQLLKNLEEGFGITEKQKKEEGGPGTKTIDRFHQNRQSAQ